MTMPLTQSGNVSARRFEIEGPLLLQVRRFGDHRGFFMETYSQRDFEAVGVTDRFVQDNHSLSATPGTLRGMHFQLPPHAQAKLVRVLRGAVLDVIVDLRRASPSFGRHVAATLTADGAEQLYVPAGFAHGFVTLEPDTEVAYKVTDYYAPNATAASPGTTPTWHCPGPSCPMGRCSPPRTASIPACVTSLPFSESIPCASSLLAEPASSARPWYGISFSISGMKCW
ncbi:dTDP-4-dehydrorhamnose 3,5-epimerase [Pseudoroseomonas wenyumeiae]